MPYKRLKDAMIESGMENARLSSGREIGMVIFPFVRK
jgi:hypothetical protein